jgi:hypothetical protein
MAEAGVIGPSASFWFLSKDRIQRVQNHRDLLPFERPVGPCLAIALGPFFPELMAAECLFVFDLSVGGYLEPLANSFVCLLLGHTASCTGETEDYSDRLPGVEGRSCCFGVDRQRPELRTREPR